MFEALRKVTEKIDLTADESREVIEQIMSGNLSPVKTAAFLTALKVKGESSSEILGAAQVMRSKVKRISHNHKMIFDNCGTGGDSSGTFNISTTSAFVIAGCGVPVAKHGNRSVSSKCGSADVLEHLGVNLTLAPEQVSRCLDEVGIGFLFAQNLHPAMKEVAPVRKELGIRTIFNLLGPLTNPAFASHQMIGVFSVDYVEKIAQVANELGIKKTMVVYNMDGIDEITTTAVNKICLAEKGDVKSFEINPTDFGFAKSEINDLRGGDVAENAKIMQSVLEGQDGPKKNTIILNSAVSLVAAEKAESIEEGIKLAKDCLESGAALEKLKLLSKFTDEIANA